jgi:hypothetical protein
VNENVLGANGDLIRVDELQENVWFNSSILNNYDTAYVKFTVSPSMAISCPMVTVEFQNSVGFLSVFMSARFLPTATKYDYVHRFYGPSITRICPSTPHAYYGTYYALLANQGGRAANVYSMRFTVSESSTCAAPVNVDYGSLVEPPATYPQTWLEDGVIQRFYVNEAAPPAGGMLYYKLYAEGRCSFFSASMLKEDVLDGEPFLFVSPTNPNPTLLNKSSFRWASVMVPGDDWVDVHYCDPDPSATHIIFYIGIFVGGAGRGGNHQIVATTQRYPNDKVALSSLAWSQYRQEMGLGAAPTLVCPSATYKCTFFPFASCEAEDVGCCVEFTQVTPSETAHPLWPWPPTDASVGEFHTSIKWLDFQPSVKGKLSWALLLEYEGLDTYRAISTQDPALCNVTIDTMLVDRNGVPLPPQTISFQPKQLVCDYDRYQEVVAKMDEITESYRGTVSNIYDLMLKQVRLVIASWDDVYLACREQILAYAEVKRASVEVPAYVCAHSPSDPEWFSDACCNPAMRATKSCRSTLATRQLPITGTADQGALKASCSNPQCSATTLQTFLESSRHEEDATRGCLAAFDYANPDSAIELPVFATRCRVDIEGLDLLGRKCRTDEDCAVVSDTSVCLADTRRCNYTSADVLRCLAARVPDTVALNLFAIWGKAERPNQSNMFAYFRDNWERELCVGPRANNFRKGFHASLIEPFCRDSCVYSAEEPYCMDPAIARTAVCEFPRQCDRVTDPAICFRFWRPVYENNAACLSSKICNWRRNDTYPCTQGFMNDASCATACTSATETPNVCLDCSLSIYGTCLEVPTINSQSECEQGYCTADSSVTDPSVCATLGTCSALCPGCDQSACESTGTCSDYMEFKSLIDLGNTGVCIRPRYWTNTSYACPYSGFTKQVSWGCINPNPTLTQTACEGLPAPLGARWYPFATDEASCTTGHACWSYTYRRFLDRSEAECAICEGVDCHWQPIYSWSNGTWTPGSMQVLSWEPRQYYTPTTVESTLDYYRIFEDVQAAITRDHSYTYYTDSLCRYDSKNDLVRSVVCDCTTDNPSSTCFAELGAAADIGSALLCPYQGRSLRTSAAIVDVPEEAVDPATGCHVLTVKLTSVGKYQVPPDHSVTHALFRKVESNPYLIVVNDKDAIVGQLISDAATVEFDFSPLEPFRLCMFTEDFIEIDTAATLYMLAKLQEDLSIQVYEQSEPITTGEATNRAVESNSSRIQVCGTLTEGGTFFAVAVVPNYAKLDPRPSAEMVAAVVFYSFIIVFGFVQLVLLVIDRERQKLLTFKIVAIVIVMVNAAARMVYIVPPPNAFKKGSESIQFIIFELPSFLYFSVFIVIVYLWIIVVLNTQAFGKRAAVQRRTKRIRNAFILINVFMYFIFVIFIYLIAILPQSTARSPCFLGNLDSAVTSVERSIKIAYWIYQLVVSIVLCVGFMVAAVMLLRIVYALSKRDLGRQEGAAGVSQRPKRADRSNSTNFQMIIITVVAFVCAIFLLVRSCIFLDVAVNGTTLHVIVFCLLEIVPQAMLLFYLHPFRCFREAGRKSTSHSSSRGRSLSLTNSKTGSNAGNSNVASQPFEEHDESSTDGHVDSSDEGQSDEEEAVGSSSSDESRSEDLEKAVPLRKKTTTTKLGKTPAQ